MIVMTSKILNGTQIIKQTIRVDETSFTMRPINLGASAPTKANRHYRE
jgi:hypothetical protein